MVVRQRRQAMDPQCGVADAYSILANAPGGPTWFVVERDAEGFSKGNPEGQAWHPAVEHRRPARPYRPV
jgi:hypothetical protein